MALYAEDFNVGDEFSFGSHTVTESEIIEFAEKYDPQPFHTDPDAATESLFDGLVASGWHVVSLTNRLVTDAVYGPAKVLGGYGTDELRFHRPTRPGDTLTGTVEVAEISPRNGHLSQTAVRFNVTTRTDGEDTILTMDNTAIVARRTPRKE